jgi:adenylosuccinate lyase|eukprot:g2371.t1
MSDTQSAVPRRDKYENPLVSRYASKEMSYVWSPEKKFTTWRSLWIHLAEGQRELGLDISEEQIAELRRYRTNINYEVAKEREKQVRHDVMSHVHAYGVQCPSASGIIHLGATSCFIADNTELVQIRDGMRLIYKKLAHVMKHLRAFSEQYKALPTLGFTHYQPAQLVTVGKRSSLWLQDFLFDFQQLEFLLEKLPLRGIKGTTGTQASFLELFEGDHEKVVALDRLVSEKLGFARTIPVSGQTYSRKLDYQVIACLSAICQSAYKMGGDIRLLANLKEIEEPFGKSQIGSSAMAYKRNPMRSERMCSLARFVMSLASSAANTASNQWLERTLDDSANRRLTLPEAFLGTDVVLNLAINIIDGLQVWPNVIKSRVMSELPFMTTEVILMAAVKAGGNRQELHEAIREHSMAAGRRVKTEGAANDLLDRIKADALFAAVHHDLERLVDPSLFIGRCVEQVEGFLKDHVDPVLVSKAHLLANELEDEISV